MRYTIILILLAFASCMTESKVHRWLDDHEYKAATYCSQKFPADTVTKTEFKYVDSSDYQDAYLRVSDYADNLLSQLDSVTHAATPDMPYKPNTDSLRRVIEIELRKRLRPCIDSVIHVTSTVIDHKREAVLQGMNDAKDKLLTEKDQINTRQQKTIQDLTEKVHEQLKWFWLFWGLVGLIGLYVFAKIRFKLPF